MRVQHEVIRQAATSSSCLFTSSYNSQFLPLHHSVSPNRYSDNVWSMRVMMSMFGVFYTLRYILRVEAMVTVYSSSWSSCWVVTVIGDFFPELTSFERHLAQTSSWTESAMRWGSWSIRNHLALTMSCSKVVNVTVGASQLSAGSCRYTQTFMCRLLSVIVFLVAWDPARSHVGTWSKSEGTACTWRWHILHK